MPHRPSMKTPVPDLVLTTREIAQWYERNETTLTSVVTHDFGDADAGRATAALLAGEEEEYQTELREDVAWTNEKDALVGSVAPTYDVITAGVEMAYYNDENLEDVLRDFDIGAPSQIRTLPRAIKAFQTLASGLKTHEDKLRAVMSEYDELLDECEQAHTRVNELSDAYGREGGETRRAARERKTAREQALEFIDHVELAARMAGRTDPELLDELHAIYAKYVPQPNKPEPVEA